jgi:predicted nucleic acid-binding protein
MAEPGRVYFDSCIFIELLQQSNQKRFDACEDLRRRAERKEIIIVTSAITITEVNKLPEADGLPEEHSKQILDFFEHSYIAVRPAVRQTTEYAHELTRTHKLAPMDAIHVATAIQSNAAVLYTYDGAKRRGRKGLIRHSLNIGVPPLSIEAPPDPLKGTLFDPKYIESLTGTTDGTPQAKAALPFKGEVAATAPSRDDSDDA